MSRKTKKSPQFEDEKDEISSLSDNSADDVHRVRDKTGKIIKRGKLNRKKTREMTPIPFIRLNEHYSLRTSVYDKFITKHGDLLNQGDVEMIRDTLLYPVALPELVTVARHWARTKPTDPAPANPMGQFNYVEFCSIEDSITYCSQFFNLVPDGLLRVAPPKVTHHGEITKAISAFNFTGTLVAKIALPSDVAQNPNEHIHETREALVKADPWAPPPGQSFTHEKTVRKRQADPTLGEADIISNSPEFPSSSTEESPSSSSLTVPVATTATSSSSPPNEDVNPLETQLMQMTINIKGITIYHFRTEDSKLLRIEYHYYE